MRNLDVLTGSHGFCFPAGCQFADNHIVAHLAGEGLHFLLILSPGNFIQVLAATDFPVLLSDCPFEAVHCLLVEFLLHEADPPQHVAVSPFEDASQTVALREQFLNARPGLEGGVPPLDQSFKYVQDEQVEAHLVSGPQFEGDPHGLGGVAEPTEEEVALALGHEDVGVGEGAREGLVGEGGEGVLEGSVLEQQLSGVLVDLGVIGLQSWLLEVSVTYVFLQVAEGLRPLALDLQALRSQQVALRPGPARHAQGHRQVVAGLPEGVDAGQQHGAHVEVPPVVVFRPLDALVDAEQRLPPLPHLAVQQAAEVEDCSCRVGVGLPHLAPAHCELLLAPLAKGVARLPFGLQHQLQVVEGQAEGRFKTGWDQTLRFQEVRLCVLELAMAVEDDALAQVHVVVESPFEVGGNSEFLLELHKLETEGEFSETEEAVAEEHGVDVAKLAVELISGRLSHFYLLVCCCEGEAEVFLDGHESCDAISVVPAHEADHSLDESDEHSQFGLLLDALHQSQGFIEVPLSDKHHQMQSLAPTRVFSLRFFSHYPRSS